MPTNISQNEIHSLTLTPWSPVHPRNDHQLIFPLSDDRLMFVWCEYYQRKPSLVFRSSYDEGGSMDDAPCQISAKISRDRGRTWSGRFTLQENRGVNNVKHPNLLRLPSGEILFSLRSVIFGRRIFAFMSNGHPMSARPGDSSSRSHRPEESTSPTRITSCGTVPGGLSCPVTPVQQSLGRAATGRPSASIPTTREEPGRRAARRSTFPNRARRNRQ